MKNNLKTFPKVSDTSRMRLTKYECKILTWKEAFEKELKERMKEWNPPKYAVIKIKEIFG